MSDETNPQPFLTERTKLWRARDIKPWFKEAVDIIERFGCQVLSVAPGNISPSFSYTTGVFDTCGKPELITVGLASGVAHHALNEAVNLMKQGVDLRRGRHRDLIGDVEVEFRPVAAKWLRHVMLRTDWYYEGAEVPVLQLVYPDLENRFEGEEGFNEHFSQPNLTPAMEMQEGSIEYDFWACNDQTSSFFRWKFPDPPHTSAYLSQTVNNGDEPVTYVSHDLDGDWQFLGDQMSEGGGPVLSCLHHPIDKDRSLEELHDLPPGWYATRDNSGSPWQRFEHPPESDIDQASENVDPTLLN